MRGTGWPRTARRSYPVCRPAVAQARRCCLVTRWRYGTAIICKARFDPPARKIATGFKDARKVTGPSQVGPRVASAGRRYPAFRPAVASSFGPLSLG